MIETVLNSLRREKDQKGYLTALTLFQSDRALTEDRANALAELYEKYGADPAHGELSRLYMALDLLPGRSRADEAVFSHLGLKKEDLDALFTAKETLTMLHTERTPDIAMVNAAMETAAGGTVSRPVALYLARSLLNALAWRWDFAAFRTQAAALASFLIDAGEETLSEYETFLEEALKKCGD